MIDFCQETMRYATSIGLGKDDDDDRRPFVSVERQYGTVRPWVVYDVTWDHGIDHNSKTEFDNQADAVKYGWKQLHYIRRIYGVAP